MKKFQAFLVVLSVAFVSASVSAGNQPSSVSQVLPTNAPVCIGKDGQPMQPNNAQVLQWKTGTANEYHDRAFIIGTVVGTTLDRKTHLQLDVDLGSSNSPGDKSDHIEIIFNKGGGDNVTYTPGDQMVACGDYITSNAPSGSYPASPLDAIIHWVHASSSTVTHPSGFMEIHGTVYGLQDPGTASKKGFVNLGEFDLQEAAGF